MNLTEDLNKIRMDVESRKRIAEIFFERLALAKVEEWESPSGARLLKVEWSKP